MNDKTLFVVAAGLSTRFSGRPKHLVQINDTSVVENTLIMAKRHYRNIWVVLNERADIHIIDATKSIVEALGARVVLIPSGKGDADAVYQALLATKCSEKHVSVCWGDSWFTDEAIFKTAARRLDESKDTKYVFDAMCAFEEDPYGWFDVDLYGNIARCTFMSDLESFKFSRQLRYHDQCFFNIDTEEFTSLYDVYLPEIEQHANEASRRLSSSMFKFSVKYEVSWYKMINWALELPLLPHPIPHSIVTVLEKPMAKSFNTEEDLEELKRNA